ncbi:type II toxin-antitoxin system RelE family toxin [Desulfonema magnum]|uniref:Toxin-antitoxin system, toxin component domain-containing protein, RelE/ParE-like n=1 Tax=Desulfonema magnum TaxID=45655 RepID=A0A975BS82_9BACT|nr:type II toxin-antitoxin system RelE/ParE family toxin [Desulfonema magnum]QTA90635.1 Toxin-antitoxin system, toxin component domain-containing protein, RelE/ParE-like [Desulfonema magnum]
MDDYTITFARSARKELENLDSASVGNIFSRIEKLAEVPRPRGCSKIQGRKNLWRIREGKYRIIYSVDDKKRLIDIIAIRHRREAYRAMRFS